MQKHDRIRAKKKKKEHKNKKKSLGAEKGVFRDILHATASATQCSYLQGGAGDCDIAFWLGAASQCSLPQ